MPGTLPRIIGDIGITLKNTVTTDIVDKMPHCLGHGVNMPGSSGNGLGNHMALFIEYPG